ncbi:MAG: MTAP family purine nucleoside phosphorylase [Candidatus Sericytochromatia bacterium]
MTLALISGSGFYQLPGLEARREARVETPFGPVNVQHGRWQGQELVFLARHGAQHQRLSHQIPHQAHLSACRELGVQALVGCSVVGVVNPALPLGELLLPDELYFPDNRLADGSACTLFVTPGEAGRGHLIAGQHFHAGLNTQLRAAAQAVGLPLHSQRVYGQVQGPRFNSRPEIRQLAQAGVDMISQTLGPEAVLAGELEIPYAALCFGVDYANGVQTTPTPIAELEKNMKASQGQLVQVLGQFVTNYRVPAFDAFVYRFK